MIDTAKHFKNRTLRLVAEHLRADQRFSVANTAWTSGTSEKTFTAVASAARIQLKDWVRIVSVVQAALNAGYRECLKASPFNLMFGRKPYSIFPALVARGKYELQVDSLDPDSVQVMVRDFMDVQARRREGMLELVRKNRARMRGVERKRVLPEFAVGDYVLVAGVRQPGIPPKLMNTWTGPRRVVSKTGGHVYGVEDIVTGRSREVHIARVQMYADASLNVPRS